MAKLDCSPPTISDVSFDSSSNTMEFTDTYGSVTCINLPECKPLPIEKFKAHHLQLFRMDKGLDYADDINLQEFSTWLQNNSRRTL